MKLIIQFTSILMLMSLSFFLLDFPAVQSEDTVFDDQEVKGKAMVNHVIKEILTNTDASCRIKCHLIKRCVSYNLGPSTTPGMMVCQLNDADRHQYPQDYQDRSGYSYRGIKKPCVRLDEEATSSELTVSAKAQEQCVCFNGYSGKHCAEKAWVKLNQDPVCVGAKDDAFGTVEIPFECKNKQLKLVHVSGKLSHWGNGPNIVANWGSTRSPEILCIIITDIDNKPILPSSGYPGLRSMGKYFTVDGINSTSPELIYPEPFVSSKGDQIRIWLGEDLYDFEESDNYGTTCADVYVRDY